MCLMTNVDTRYTNDVHSPKNRLAKTDQKQLFMISKFNNKLAVQIGMPASFTL